jgi:hypothetical protein
MHQQHVEALEARHARTEDLLHEQMIRPQPDSAACADLKKRKLALKDEIERERS